VVVFSYAAFSQLLAAISASIQMYCEIVIQINNFTEFLI
jgi:hypothetical protein